jgi:TonB-linked SusC/RagA family outer membrane protein
MALFTPDHRHVPILKYRFLRCCFILLVLLLPAFAFAQNKTVTGTVTDEKGETLPGVSVTIKGTGTATVTDIAGHYAIKVPDLNGALVFSFIGYVKREEPIKSRVLVNIAMKAEINNLNEVVVVGYGSTKRKDLTGSVAAVNMADFEKAPVKSFDEALGGRIAGVQVSSNDGQPGSVANIVVRGPGSITQDNSPLYVVDGFPLESANNNSINPADIETIDVLKDASATAIYGSRGANGVIMITTKRGKNGAPQVTYNGYYGVQKNPKTIAVMDPYNFVKMALELDPTNTPLTYFTNGQTLDSYKNMAGLNLQDQLYRVAPYQNHDIALRGGNDQTRYSVSANYQNQDGVIINSGFNRIQGRVTLDQNINSKIKVGINANYANSNSYGAPIAASNFSASISTLYGVWGYRPVTGTGTDLSDQLYDPGLAQSNVYSDYRVNPIIDLQNRINKTKANNLDANAYFDYEIISGLKLRVTGGISTINNETDAFYNSSTSNGGPYSSSGVNGSIYYNTASTWLNENTLSYTKTFHNDHHLTALVGFTNQFSNTGVHGFNAAQVPNESQGLDALGQSTSLTATSTTSRWGLESYLGRVNYDYKSKYLLTASFRADGSSKFAPENRWGYFPSGSVAWRMINEDFLKNSTLVSDAKLRVSYGQTGNNRVSDFAYLSQINFPVGSSYSYNNANPSLSAVIAAFGNAGLKWETTTQTDIGYDLGLFKQRITLTADVYRKVTNNLLLNASLPYTTGASNAFKNVGKMQNQGLELTLNTINIQSKGFTWTSNFNISFNQNKVLALTENQQYLATTVTFDTKYNNITPYIAVLGQPVGQMYGYIFDGVYQYSDFDKLPNGTYALKPNVPTNSNARANIKPGDVKFKDLNGDGVINAQDLTIIGRGLPINTGGFSNNFTYKNFDLNVFLQWSYGNDLINANRMIFEGNTSNNPYLNQYATYDNRWEPNNPSNTYYRAGGGINAYSSNIIEDGSYLKLKTVSLGYTLPASVLSKVKIHSVRIYTSAQNLYTWTNYSGPDPEVSTRNSTLTPGFDYAAYPHSRTIVFGLNATF